MKISRRQLLLGTPVACGALLATGSLVEPYMIEETFLDKSEIGLGKKIVHFSDLHFKGDLEFGRRVVGIVNSKNPDLVLFSGDLVESGSSRYIQQALDLLKKIGSPCYAVLGNHDPGDSDSLDLYARALDYTGGRLLQDDRVDWGEFVLHGITGRRPFTAKEGKNKLLLCHYPIVGKADLQEKYDLILCGHSHGGQVRLPFWGAVILPFGVGRYVSGYYRSKAGDLYVNRGVGEFLIPVRFCCRPEITEIAT